MTLTEAYQRVANEIEHLESESQRATHRAVAAVAAGQSVAAARDARLATHYMYQAQAVRRLVLAAFSEQRMIKLLVYDPMTRTYSVAEDVLANARFQVNE